MFSSNKKSIGIDVADHTIEVVELSKKSKAVRVVSISRAKINPGIVENGRILDAAKFIKIVKKTLNEAKPQPIVPEQIVLGLPESQVYVHAFKLKTHKKEDREKLVQKEVETHIPLPSSDLLYSYKLVSKTQFEMEILLVAVSRETVLEWQEAFQKLNIQIDIFDVESLAVFRGLYLSQTLKAPICIVDIGATTTNVSIFDKKGLRYVYTVNVAGENLSLEISKALNKSGAEAEEMKKKFGLLKTNKKIYSALSNVLQPVVVDIKKTLKHYEDKTGSGITEVVLVGGTSSMKGLVEYFSETLGVKTKLGKQALFKSKTPRVYIEAVGLALRGIVDKWEDTDPAILIKQDEVSAPEASNMTGMSSLGLFNGSKKTAQQTYNQKNESSETNTKLHNQKIILLTLLVVGMILIPASFWYSGYKKSLREAEIQLKLEAIDRTTQKQEVEEDLSSVEENDTIDTRNNISDAVVKVIVLETPTGWLNVREGPGLNFSPKSRIYPGEIYVFLEQIDDWFKVRLNEEGEGWVFSEYLSKQ